MEELGKQEFSDNPSWARAMAWVQDGPIERFKVNVNVEVKVKVKVNIKVNAKVKVEDCPNEKVRITEGSRMESRGWSGRRSRWLRLVEIRM